MAKKLNNTKGITLITLVITIILLLILAGIVINMALGENGLLKRTKEAKLNYEEQAVKETIERIILQMQMEEIQKGEELDLKKIAQIIENKDTNITLEEYVEGNEELIGTYKLNGEEYSFKINEKLEVSILGKADGKPNISNIQIIEVTPNSIKVKITGSQLNGGKFTYGIKNITAGETNYTVKANQISENEYEFTGLTQDNEYSIEVKVENDKGERIKQTDKPIKAELPSVREISLNKTTISIGKGSTEKLTVTVLPINAKDTSVTYTSSDTNVVTVDETGLVTAVGEGTATITVTANGGEGINTTCNITVTPPPPPTIEVGADNHEAKEIQYNWEELNSIAKVISDNYGTEQGKINNDTVEVAVSINGKEDTLGIGDWTTVNGNKVIILGFNHDQLANSNKYAGISFQFTKIIEYAQMNSSGTNADGWEACKFRETLNSTIYDTLENVEYIKEVKKHYIQTYNDIDSVTTSQDKLWLLSCSEIWDNGDKEGYYGYAIAKEGEQYKYYKNIDADSDTKSTALVDSLACWWLRSPAYNDKNSFCYTSGQLACKYQWATQNYGIQPGFSI